MRLAAGLLIMALAACGASASSPSAMFEDYVVNHAPTQYAMAASSTFFRCKAGKEADEYWCYACEVSVHETDEGGLVAYATDYEHKLQPWEEGGPPKISVTGEVGNETFTSDAQAAADAHRLFDEANAWCQARRKGTFHLLKDEIDTHFSGKVE